MMSRLAGTLASLAWVAFATPLAAEPLAFGPDLGRSGWSAVSFPGIRPASFAAVDERTLAVATDGAAGLLWRPLGPALRSARKARWRWRADEAVLPTDLTRRGADDRVLAVYLVFGAAGDAGRGALDLLMSSSTSALVYVFGGAAARGAVLPSPHMGARGRFVVLRAADAALGAWFDESVDIGADYRRAFAAVPPPLLAVAVTSDSDDTRSRNRAMLADLAIGE